MKKEDVDFVLNSLKPKMEVGDLVSIDGYYTIEQIREVNGKKCYGLDIPLLLAENEITPAPTPEEMEAQK